MPSDVERTPGVILPRNCSLDEVLGALKGELSLWFWWVDVQSGPFRCPWRDDVKNDAIIERLYIDVPEFRNSCATAWDRGFVPKLHSHIYIDEWTYFYGANCAPSEFPSRAAHSYCLFSSSNQSEFYRWLASSGDLLIMYVDGWWEIYTNHANWQQYWLNAFPEAFIRTWRESGEAPEIPPTSDPRKSV